MSKEKKIRKFTNPYLKKNRTWIYLLVSFIIYMAIPQICTLLPEIYLILSLWALFSVITFVENIIYGVHYGIKQSFIITNTLLLLPVIFGVYGIPHLIYLVFHYLMSFFGSYIGSRKNK